MKKIQCLDCSKEFVGETKEEVLNLMQPHYMQDHKEMMQGTLRQAQGDSDESEKKKEWFERFDKAWESAQEI